MKITLKRLSFCIASAGMLTIYGCGGGGGGSSPAAATMTVTPSLGQFSKGTKVNLNKLSGSLLSTGTIGTDGKVTLSLAGYTDPVVVEVLGGTDVKYYDEGTKTLQDFGSSRKLRALVPAGLTEVGVTALTNAAAEKLKEADGTFKSATATTINGANAKVAAVFGLPDILVAPKPVDSSTGNTLNLAAPGDKYALILAALAKTAQGTNSAADVADALANDLKKDDQIDGQEDSASAAPVALTAYAPTTLAAKYQEAASESADDSSKLLAPLQPLVVNPNVGGVKAVTNQSDVTLAKAMFAELRTTLKSFANGNKTGFLDSQATRINADLNANVAPELSKVANRISTLGDAMSAFEDASVYTSTNTMGFVAGFVPNTTPANSTPALVRQHGNLLNVWHGVGSFNYCWTDAATGVSNKVTCAHAGSDSADRGPNSKIKMVIYELTKTGTNQYAYTATRYNKKITFDPSGQPVFSAAPTLVTADAAGNPMPTGSGTLGKTFSGTTMTGLAINGTLTPSASSTTGLLVTGADTIAISAARTAQSAADNFRYALSGSVSTTNLAVAAKIVTVSFDNGSYVDLNESNAATTGSKIVAVKLIGTAKTAASKFTGTLDVGSFATDASGKEYSPTKMAFTGSISDTSTSGAGEFLTGKLEATVANYSQFNTTLPDSSSNYVQATLTFTGTIQAPSRPLMKLVLAVAKTSPSTSTVMLEYTYGTVKIMGRGKVDGDNPGNETLTLSNQDNIQVDANTGIVTKAGVRVATIANGAINYVDGVTESLI